MRALTRAGALLALLSGCRVVVEYPDLDVFDPDGPLDSARDTDVVDSGDTGVADDTAVVDDTADCDDRWWPGADVDGDGRVDLGHRIRVSVTGGARGVPRAPLAFDVDFAGALTGEAFDPASVRVVVQDCALGFPELPAQFVDALQSLALKTSHSGTDGDGDGAVVALWDLDGDLGTDEVLAAGATVELAVYFDAMDAEVPARSWTTDLAVTETDGTHTLSGAGTRVSVDGARGGLLSEMALDGGDSLGSQASSCCGNGMAFWDADTYAGPPFGWVVPQKDGATVEVVAEGPVFVAVRATGSRVAEVPELGTPYGSYDFELLYWRFAGRPETWHTLTHVATSDCTTEHEHEASFGFRPVQILHDLDSTEVPSFESDQAGRWGAVHLPDRGFAVGLHQPPTFFARVSNPVGIMIGSPNPATNYFAIHGNDVVDVGVPSPATVPSGAAYFDAIGVVFLPFESWNSAQTVFEDALQGITGGVPGVLEKL